jgi:hypothetical protein
MAFEARDIDVRGTERRGTIVAQELNAGIPQGLSPRCLSTDIRSLVSCESPSSPCKLDVAASPLSPVLRSP